MQLSPVEPWRRNDVEQPGGWNDEETEHTQKQSYFSGRMRLSRMTKAPTAAATANQAGHATEQQVHNSAARWSTVSSSATSAYITSIGCTTDEQRQ
jgi:hypothetical protein